MYCIYIEFSQQIVLEVLNRTRDTSSIVSRIVPYTSRARAGPPRPQVLSASQEQRLSVLDAIRTQRDELGARVAQAGLDLRTPVRG